MPSNPSTMYGRIPDASDRASSIVGCNINDYVFGNNSSSSPIQQGGVSALPAQGAAKSGKATSSLGAFALGALAFGTFCSLRKGAGKKIPVVDLKKFHGQASTFKDSMKGSFTKAFEAAKTIK